MQADLTLDAAAVDQVVHAVEAAQQRGLATAAGADERGDLLLRDAQADVLQRLLGAVEQIEPVDLGRNGFVVHAGADLLALERFDVDAVSQRSLGLNAGHAGVFHKVRSARRRINDPAPCSARAAGCGS
jgi:hypothetical protein